MMSLMASACRCRDAPMIYLLEKAVEVVTAVINREIRAAGASAETIARCAELKSCWDKRYSDTRMEIEESRTLPRWDFHYVADIFPRLPETPPT